MKLKPLKLYDITDSFWVLNPWEDFHQNGWPPNRINSWVLKGFVTSHFLRVKALSWFILRFKMSPWTKAHQGASRLIKAHQGSRLQAFSLMVIDHHLWLSLALPLNQLVDLTDRHSPCLAGIAVIINHYYATIKLTTSNHSLSLPWTSMKKNILNHYDNHC